MPCQISSLHVKLYGMKMKGRVKTCSVVLQDRQEKGWGGVSLLLTVRNISSSNPEKHNNHWLLTCTDRECAFKAV